MRGGFALIAALALAGCTDIFAPGAAVDLASTVEAVPLLDPLAEGPFAVAFADYDAGTVEVGGPDVNHSAYDYDARVRGRAWWPEAAGAYPLLVFLHGQHDTCAFMGDESLLIAPDDCSDDEGLSTAYPNHLGYEYLATHLASNGYVVLSILGYEVNRYNDEGSGEDVGMWARGEVILSTLDAVRAGAQGMPADAVARSDLARIGLMGHSRGGEGVVTAVHVNLARSADERHVLSGIVALAPTDFNERGVPDVALLSLSPYCDGDVYNLHGLRTYDHSRLLDDATPKVQLVVRGANHNFYNTRWYDDVGTPVRPGDDGMFDLFGVAGGCGRERGLGGARLTPLEMQRQSIVHVGGFLRWSAGGETGLAPYFTGELPLPEQACAGCAQVVAVTAHLPRADELVVVNNSVPDALALDGFDDASVCAFDECGWNVYSAAPALDLSWSAAASLSLAFDAPRDWREYDSFSLRAADPTPGAPTDVPFAVELVFRDATGRAATVDARAISSAFEPTPDLVVGTPLAPFGTSKVALQAVRVPLAELGIDLAQVSTVEVAFSGQGRALLTDLLVQAEPDVVA